MSRAEQFKAKRRAARYRRLRKFRSEWKYSSTGMRGRAKSKSGGPAKKVRKKFYFDTYDANGRRLGTFWFSSTRISRDAIEHYSDKHGVRHPAILPVRDDEQVQRLRSKSA